MSSISVNTITDASGGATATINGYTPTMSNMAGRNRIINGAMVFDQRNAGASVPANGGYTLDRWEVEASQSGKLNIQQQTSVVPAEFSYAAAFTSLSAYSLGASDFFLFRHIVEGFNVADLGWGTADAKTVTLSFWVRSSLTGTFGAAICNGANNRAYPVTYTISSADTWEHKSVTIAGDTTGTWGKINDRGIAIRFGLGVGTTRSATAGQWTGVSGIYGATGATSVVGTSGATFYITGVQLEEGSVATPFEHVDYSEMLRRCQRYCWVGRGAINTGTYFMYNISYGNWVGNFGSFPVTMRATPTMSFTGGGGVNCSSVSVSAQSPHAFTHQTSGGGSGQVGNYAGATYTATAEL